jgi:hypothetical protein
VSGTGVGGEKKNRLVFRLKQFLRLVAIQRFSPPLFLFLPIISFIAFFLSLAIPLLYFLRM